MRSARSTLLLALHKPLWYVSAYGADHKQSLAGDGLKSEVDLVNAKEDVKTSRPPCDAPFTSAQSAHAASRASLRRV